METVIYDTSVFWAFRAGWISLLFALALIAFGVFFALPRGVRARLLRRKVESVRPEPVFLRIWLGLAAVVVALGIGVMTNAQVRDFLDGPRTITFVPAELAVRTTTETGSRPLRYQHGRPGEVDAAGVRAPRGGVRPPPPRRVLHVHLLLGAPEDDQERHPD